MDDIDTEIAKANFRLKSLTLRVTIERRGESLYLRSTLPPKPNSNRLDDHQQRVCPKLSANLLNIHLAEQEAHKLAALRDMQSFSWELYTRPKKIEVRPISCQEWIERFQDDYFQRRERNYRSESTWKNDYHLVFKRLPPEPLTATLIKTLILSTKPDTKTRRCFCISLNALARFAGIDIDVKPYIGSYGPKKVTPRDLPSDELIVEWFFKIPRPDWQWVYGMLVTFGLRNHEVFFVDLNALTLSPHIASVTNGKTGARKIWAYHPEWVEQFNLKNIQIPQIKLDRPNMQIGTTVSHYFGRYLKLPFPLLALRHCWAVRTLQYGLDISLAAKQMGHSLQVHSDLYHHWIADRYHQAAYEKAIASVNRPLPPPLPP